MISPYAAGQDPHLKALLERTKDFEERIQYLKSNALHLRSGNGAGSDDSFRELEAAIKILLEGLILDLRNAKSLIPNKLAWLWYPPDYVEDHLSFIGRLYYTLKLVE